MNRDPDDEARFGDLPMADPAMTGAEAETAAAIHAAAFAGPHAIRPWGPQEFIGFCASPGAFRALGPDALMLGRVVGPEAELVTIATRPRARRRGLARGLLVRFARRAAALGAESAFLEVAEPNDGARALYLAAGWIPVGKRRDYYRLLSGGRADAVVMSLDLQQLRADPECEGGACDA